MIKKRIAQSPSQKIALSNYKTEIFKLSQRSASQTPSTVRRL